MSIRSDHINCPVENLIIHAKLYMAFLQYYNSLFHSIETFDVELNPLKFYEIDGTCIILLPTQRSNAESERRGITRH